jgi:hypothetical protein
MKRLLLLTLATAAAISLVAVLGVRSLGGSGGVASANVGTGVPHIELDLVEDGPNTWCNPVQNDASVDLGAVHKVAICLSDATSSPGAFNIELNYDAAKVGGVDLNSCTDKPYNNDLGFDQNPDANEGTTVFSGSAGAGALGTGCDCASGTLNPPTCNYNPDTPNPKTAFISCTCTASVTLPAGNGISSPLAVVTFQANGTVEGVDTLSFGTVAVYPYSGPVMLRCPSANCYGADVHKVIPPTPTPPPPECDIAAQGIAANPPSLNMKVGAPPAIVDLSGTWKNLGHVTSGAGDATCAMGFAWGAEMLTSTPGVFAPIPSGISLRMEPLGLPSQQGGGDVCLVCFGSGVGKPIGDCLLGHGPFDNPPVDPSQWTYTVEPCDEGPFSAAFPMSTLNGSCEDGIDNQPSAAGCDWAGFSALCTPATTPDPACRDVPAIGILPLSPFVLAPGASVTPPIAREVKIQCNERGTYPLVIFGSDVSATNVANGKLADPNPANDVAFTPLTVTCTKGPEMVKDCDPNKEGIQDNCNLWLMDTEFAGKTLPEALPAADDNGCVVADEGKGCLAVDVWLKSADDEPDSNDMDNEKECLGAWEHQVRFDHKIIKFVNDLNPATIDTDQDGDADVSWLESTGRIANCSYSVLTENWMLEGCLTKDDPNVEGVQVGPCGDGIIEKMLIVPQTQDLIYRGIFRPTKDNGVVTNIVDDNCEITDIYGEPMADTLPGQLTPVCGDLHITIRMLEGDLDLDCDVDVADDQAVAFRYGASWGLQLYDPWFDLEPKYADQDIDIKDLQFVFGRNYSTCQAPIPVDQAFPVEPPQP